MITFWLDQSISSMFLILAFGFAAVMAAIQILTFAAPFRRVALTFAGVAPSYFSVLATLLALLTGFVASDTWARQKQAEHLVQAEADGALAVYDLSVAAAPDMSAIRATLKDYVGALIDDEWPRMAQGKSSARAAAALGTLLQQVADPKIGRDAGGATQSALLDSVLKIRNDRGARLALNEHRSDTTKWLALLILGVLTQVAIGIVHLERPRAQFAALLIFTTGLVSTLGLVAIHEWPFDGADVIRPTELSAALARMT